MAPLNLIVAVLISLLVAVSAYFLSPLVLRRLIVDGNGNVLPPGPFFRYAFLEKYSERTIDFWAKKFGPLFSVWMGDQLFVIISDPHIAKDLIVTNGSIFSSRKRYFLKNQIILRGRAITAMEYGDRWRQHRRIAGQLLTPKAMAAHTDMMDYESHILIRSLYEESLQGKMPINPAHYTGRFALNNMLNLSFGTRTISTSTPLIKRVLDLATEFNELTGPLSNVVDFFRPLQWIPTSMHSRGHKLHDGLVETYGGIILEVKARMQSGEHVPDCLVKTLIETQEEEKLDWEDLCMLATVFALGGVHSLSGLIQWFLALIPSHPEVLEAAHEELDRVIGRDRWPTAEDEPNLPYIRAIIKEVERLHAPFWMATPHYTTQDYAYNGNYIPKGTAVLLNCYTLHHDEERYPDSFAFKPERYLKDRFSSAESARQPNVMERDHWTFGAGRRICPGIQVAERELWLAISRLLWCFSFESLPEEPISLEEYEGLSGRTPVPFRLKFIPRVERLGELLQTREEVIF